METGGDDKGRTLSVLDKACEQLVYLNLQSSGFQFQKTQMTDQAPP